MDDEIETLIVGVRADTVAFAKDVKEMRAQLEGPLAAGAERAGRMIEDALVRAVRTGKLGFEDLKRIALSAMQEITAAAIRNGIGAVLAGGGGKSGGIGGLVGGLLGLPGRATGGPVAPGRAYLVGERGPELFVPTASGKVEPGRQARDVRITIAVHAPAGGEPRALAQSSRQVARAVKRALAQTDD